MCIWRCRDEGRREPAGERSGVCAGRLQPFPCAGARGAGRRLSRVALSLGADAGQSLLGADDAQAGFVDCAGGALRDGLEWADHQREPDQRSLIASPQKELLKQAVFDPLTASIVTIISMKFS
ncbi:hypothetical protein EMIT0P258_110114 [Pseudomonas sp. IT-P258]